MPITVTDRISQKLKAILLASGVALGGLISAVLGVGMISPIYESVVSKESPIGRIAHLFVVQPGMGIFAVGYLWLRGPLRRYVRVRTPSLEGVGWMVLGPVAYWGLTTQVVPRLLEVGGGHGNNAFLWEVFLDHPSTLVPTLLIVSVMAPAEEMVYRGIVHGELRRGFGMGARIVLGALLFGGIHMVLSSGLASGILTGTGGLVFATAYERTDNLLVTATIHAVVWLIFSPMV